MAPDCRKQHCCPCRSCCSCCWPALLISDFLRLPFKRCLHALSSNKLITKLQVYNSLYRCMCLPISGCVYLVYSMVVVRWCSRCSTSLQGCQFIKFTSRVIIMHQWSGDIIACQQQQIRLWIIEVNSMKRKKKSWLHLSTYNYRSDSVWSLCLRWISIQLMLNSILISQLSRIYLLLSMMNFRYYDLMHLLFYVIIDLLFVLIRHYYRKWREIEIDFIWGCVTASIFDWISAINSNCLIKHLNRLCTLCERLESWLDCNTNHFQRVISSCSIESRVGHTATHTQDCLQFKNPGCRRKWKSIMRWITGP